MAMSATQWARKLWAALDTPVSLSLEILYRHKEYEQIVKKSVSPSDYLNAESFYLDYQAVKALSKYPYLDTGIDRRREAQVKFLDAEVKCAETNERFLGWSHSQEEFLPSANVRRMLYLAQRKIASILGPVPDLSELDFKFGPGANFGVRGDTSVYKKLTSPLECSFAFSPILTDFLGEFPGWFPEGTTSAPVGLVSGSELTFVPKDAKTDRPICIEPLLNGLYQKGVGSYIRSRLSHHGVNLRDQSVNQRLASAALSDGLATVDFSSASDTISYMLVLELLPIDWVQFLDVARSPSYFSEGNWYDFHKFTSMGNAYTFELETLIFYALATAACQESRQEFETGRNLHVYGDDVIIPKAAFDLFLEVCTYSGFTINQEKSFSSGVFYESCGTDWYLGHDVRPVLLKKRIQTLQDMYYVTNSTLGIAAKLASLQDHRHVGLNGHRVDALRDLHAWCVGCIPRIHRHLVPRGAGDVGLHCEFDLAVPVRHENWDGWWYTCVHIRPEKVVLPEWPNQYALYHAGSGSPEHHLDNRSELSHSDGYSPRSKQHRFRRAKAFWFGEWETVSLAWSERAVNLVRNVK